MFIETALTYDCKNIQVIILGLLKLKYGDTRFAAAAAVTTTTVTKKSAANDVFHLCIEVGRESIFLMSGSCIKCMPRNRESSMSAS